MEIVWTETGLDTLEEISDYIGEDSPINADRFIKEIYGKADLLAGSPRIGHTPPEIEKSDILQILHGEYKILYRIDIDTDTVSILAVIHGKRDFKKIKLNFGDRFFPL